MAELLPSITLRTQGGFCVELVDNCAVLSAVNNTGGWNLVKSLDCEDCCVQCLRKLSYNGVPSQDGAWWAQSGDPAEDEFLGFLIDSIDLEAANSVRRAGETSLEPPAYTPRRLTVVGRLISTSRAGTYFAETQMLALLTSQPEWEMVLQAFCSDTDVDVIPPEPFPPDGLPELLPAGDGDCGPCDRLADGYEPNLLTAPLRTPTVIDTGRRTTMRARFLSIDSTETDATPIEYCWGKDITLIFEVLDDYEWGDEIESVCVIDRPFDTFESGHCRPMNWAECLIIPDETLCVDELAVESEELETTRAPQQFDLNYCSPIYRSVRTCLTPTLPTSAEVALNFEFFAGQTALRNLRIDIYPAYTGRPSPETCPGEEFYRRQVPCARGLIAFIPEQGRLRIDGRSEQVLLSCYGGNYERSEGSIEQWTYPKLDPTCRYWIVATADCLRSAPDSTIDLSFSPRYRA